jgi:hypothetical protein
MTSMRYLVAAIAGRHWARADHHGWRTWAHAAHTILPALRPLERHRLELANLARGREMDGHRPPMLTLVGTESPDDLLLDNGHPGLLSLADRGLLVVERADWSPDVLDELAKRLSPGQAHDEYLHGPRMVIFGPEVEIATAMDLGAEVLLSGEAPEAFHRPMCVGALRNAISRLSGGWYVLPAGRTADAVIARLARSLAAADGTSHVTADLMDEARAIALRIELPRDQTP